MGVTASLDVSEINVQPGEVTELVVTVGNTGAVVDQLLVAVVGEAEAWTTIEPAEVSLFPETEEPVVLRFAPPRAATTPPGRVPFAVTVVSTQQDGARAVEEGIAHVGSFVDADAELTPKMARGRRGARVQLAVDNRGNLPATAALSVTDPANALRYHFEPAVLTIEPGTAAFARLRVEPKRRFWRGPARNHVYQALVDIENRPAVRLEGAMLQEALLPGWLPKAVATALAAVLALIALWVGLLRPRVDSALEDAADEAIAEAVKEAVEAGGGGGGGNEGTEDNPDSETRGAEDLLVADPSPFDYRLATGTSEQVSYVVPDGKTLEVTDLVFQNADSDAGYVTVSRSDPPATLLRLNLGNFRDFDFHFVSPVVFGPGQSLLLGVACGSGSDPCLGAPSLYIVGRLVDAGPPA